MTQPVKILVVHDESTALVGLAERLRRMRYEVTEIAHSGEEALLAAQKVVPALVLMNIPSTGDINTVATAMQIKERTGSEIIYVTEHFDSDLLERLKRTYPCACLKNPVSFEELHFAIEMAVHRRTMEEESRKIEERFRSLHDSELTNMHTTKFRSILENAQDLHVQITERRRTEAALRESEQRFRTIIDSATDCIFIKDESRRYTLINPAMEEVLDLPAQSILGKMDEHIFGEKEAGHSRDIDTRVLNGERIEEEYTWIIRGAPLTFLDTRVPMIIDDKIVGICGISRNITDRKRQQFIPSLGNQEYRSDAMRSTIEAALLAARRESTILLTGESGTGKDHLARFIHDRSPWAGGPFFAINCAAVPSELAESELFGHEVGSFTGANRRKRGLLELAEGGTLLLDEIGELSPSVQAKLLTFVDTKSFTRVGGEKNVAVNARLIVATNRNLMEEVAAGRFRADLFYRLNVFAVHVPPLRDRIEDLPILVKQVLEQIAAELQLPRLPWIAPDTMEKMKRYSWPGNVRELKNVLERAAILSRGPRLDSESLRLEESNDDEDPLTFRVPEGQALEEVVRDFKVFLVNRALRRTRGNKTAAARLLGVSRHSVINYLNQIKR